MLDICSPLTEEEILSAPQPPPEVPVRVVSPVPESAPDPEFSHPALGKALAAWAYRDEAGAIVGYMLRFEYVEADGRRTPSYLPLSWCVTPEGSRWRLKGLETYPLYRLPDIVLNPEKTILVCEGEKTADAAARFFPDMVTTTSPFGWNMARKSNWLSVKGRNVLVAPDLDKNGQSYADDVVRLSFEAGAASVRLLSLDKIARCEWHGGERLVRGSAPEGWDLADAAADGWEAETLRQAIVEFDCIETPPHPLPVEPPTHVHFRMTPKGVEAEILTWQRGDIINGRWEWICGPLQFVARTRDTEGKNWGLLVQVTDPDGKETEVHLSEEMLGGDGAEVRKILQSAGLKIATGRDEREALKDYLSRITGPDTATTVDRMGWLGNCFVTPGKTLGASLKGERMVMPHVSHSRAGHTSGTLGEWKEQVAKYAAGNSRLAFALSAAFAPPLLKHLNAESGGFHFVGPSSIGKSTALEVAGSVWGGGGTGGYIRPWRATANGLEGIAEAHCDALLCLDEMGQIRAHEAGHAAYMLANGIGKIRANRYGDARPPKEWRTIALSTGEVTLADKVSEEGAHNRAVAGQQTRFVDIPAVPADAETLIEKIHGFPDSGALARHLKAASRAHYGHAWEAFVQRVAADVEAITAEAEGTAGCFLQNGVSGIGRRSGKPCRPAICFGCGGRRDRDQAPHLAVGQRRIQRGGAKVL
ncbi:MAG: DUF927 domain-containing protein [Rhizobiales bacterium]|nr:DUF927 domain-containing protein [Hyphomicrobiales bacterium]